MTFYNAMNLAKQCALASAMVLVLAGAPPVAKAGHLSQIQRWTAAESPYDLTEDYVVPSDTQLVIEPGVEVRARRGVRLIVEGQLNVEGTRDEPVLFTVPTSEEERWGGIALRSTDRSHYNTISGAIVDGAVTGLEVENANVEVSDSTLHSNLTGIRFLNPRDGVSVTGSVFENNRLAITGYTRRLITLYSNDFWNNATTLLPRPQPMYDCGPDAGVWDISSNDILRGPVNSEFFSNDVRTPPGSAVSDYRVLATGNWWGTIEEEKVVGRLTEAFNCCPAPAEQPVAWRPIAIVPQTAYEPNGENPDPDVEYGGHGDPGLVTKFRSPSHGSCYSAGTFSRLKGGFGGGLGGPAKVTVALRRRTRNGCAWWSHEQQKLLPGACDERHRFRATVDQSDDPWRWRYRFRSRLPEGRYMAWSYGFAEPTHLGRNQVAFRLR